MHGKFVKICLIWLAGILLTLSVAGQEYDDQTEDEQYQESDESENNEEADADDNEDDNQNNDEEDTNEGDDDEEDTNIAKQSHFHEVYPPKTKKVFVPVYVPEKEKKKMKIIQVDKGFYIQGGTQVSGKFKSLKHCMKACAITPTCFAGDYNPWLHKCYIHTNLTACNTMRSHPQFVHFSKVPCEVTDAPAGHITLGAAMANGLLEKGIDSLSQCLKKCSLAGAGILASVATTSIPALLLAKIAGQGCFAIDYDFATHQCFFFGSEIIVTTTFLLHCPLSGVAFPSSQGTRPNPTVIHITLCPKVVG